MFMKWLGFFLMRKFQKEAILNEAATALHDHFLLTTGNQANPAHRF